MDRKFLNPAKIGHEEEDRCREFMKSLGYKIFKPSWPDFLCQNKRHIIAVECKSYGSRISQKQRLTFRFLQKIGLNTVIYSNKKLKCLNGEFYDLGVVSLQKLIKEQNILRLKNLIETLEIESVK